MRAVYEVPAVKGFTVSDIKINGLNIEFGSQIADFITIKLTGLASRLGKSNVVPLSGCVQSAGAHTPQGLVGVAQALSAMPGVSRRCPVSAGPSNST